MDAFFRMDQRTGQPLMSWIRGNHGARGAPPDF